MFITKTALRYAFSKSRGQRGTSIMIMLGIAAGLVALIVISAVMNGLQTAQLDHLRNIESFDIIVDSDRLSAEEISAIPNVDEAFSFIESSVLIVDKSSGKSLSARMRAFDNYIYDQDRYSSSFYFYSRQSDSQITGIMISYKIYSSLSFRPTDTIQVTFLKKGKTATIVPYNRNMGVSAVYGCSMSEFSSSTVFMDYDELASIVGEEEKQIGIYCSKDLGEVVRQIHAMDPDAEILTWQEYNKALYSALMLEKFMMYVFLAFMFLIICVNLKNSTKRLLVNKQREGAMLRALGCTRKQVNKVFLLQGLLISLFGLAAGVILGLLAVNNIQFLLSLMDSISRLFTGRGTVLASVPFNASIGAVEIVLICLFVFALSAVFTYVGSRKIHKSEIMEVILNVSY